jgi:hypothetical protein
VLADRALAVGLALEQRHYLWNKELGSLERVNQYNVGVVCGRGGLHGARKR